MTRVCTIENSIIEIMARTLILVILFLVGQTATGYSTCNILIILVHTKVNACTKQYDYKPRPPKCNSTPFLKQNAKSSCILYLSKIMESLYTVSTQNILIQVFFHFQLSANRQWAIASKCRQLGRSIQIGAFRCRMMSKMGPSRLRSQIPSKILNIDSKVGGNFG